jgi:DNA-binding MarR family transcriptional regulator
MIGVQRRRQQERKAQNMPALKQKATRPARPATSARVLPFPRLNGHPAPAKGSKRPGYRIDDQIGFLLRVAMQRHTAIFMANMLDDLTQTQFAALAKLHEVGPCTQNHLGRRICLDPATVKGVVDRLRSRGLVEIAKDPGDRRRHAVMLTEPGRRLTIAAVEAASKITALTIAPLSAAEQRAILRLLQKLS